MGAASRHPKSRSSPGAGLASVSESREELAKEKSRQEQEHQRNPHQQRNLDNGGAGAEGILWNEIGCLVLGIGGPGLSRFAPSSLRFGHGLPFSCLVSFGPGLARG
jgi:hypothetical protein